MELPPALQKQLLDQYDAIHDDNKLLQLPRRPNVQQVNYICSAVCGSVACWHFECVCDRNGATVLLHSSLRGQRYVWEKLRSIRAAERTPLHVPIETALLYCCVL